MTPFEKEIESVNDFDEITEEGDISSTSED